MNLVVDVVIFGGGCAGLWLLDELRRRGARVLLLESTALGGVQTTGSQGILHGGTKYALRGILSASANSVREMPARWRASLAGTAEPNLSQTRIRSRCCYLWRSDSWQSWAGMVGARAMLEVKPVPLDPSDCPKLLAKCPGQVFRLDEEVIDTTSFCHVLAERNAGLILSNAGDVRFRRDSQGSVEAIDLGSPDERMEFEDVPNPINRVTTSSGATVGSGSQHLTIQPRQVVFAAGAGNERLRRLMGLSFEVTQTRPLHMVLARGDLPILNGHCIDGAKTRVTITSDVDAKQRTVWQVGGQVAEDGVKMESLELIRHARRELEAVLPGWRSGGVEWATYRIDRAERRTTDGSRPDDVQLMIDRNVVTAWPTKLVLAPRLADLALEHLGQFDERLVPDFLTSLRTLNWPTPPVAVPPWERQATWISDV